MEDQMFKKLLDFVEKFPINNFPGFTNIMSLDSKYIKVSDSSLKLIGYKNHDLLFNTSYEDMPCVASENAESFIKEDKAALEQEITILSYSDFNEWTVLLGHKKPIKVDNEVIGTIANFLDVTHSGLVDMGRFLLCKDNSIRNQQVSFIIENTDNYHSLTKKQQECLFFLMRGLSYAGISKQLNIAISTVQTHIEHIKDKFKVNNKSQIIEKAISLGFMNIIPKSLMNDK